LCRDNQEVQVAATPTDTQIHENNRAVMRRLLDMEDVAYALNIGRSTAFAVVQSGELRSVKIKNRRLVTVEALEEFLQALEANA
jgi:excisionase family DNA binding protein